jgi:hypothetical protein
MSDHHAMLVSTRKRENEMAVTLTLTENQAKALVWLLGSSNATINADLQLSPIYSVLRDQFGPTRINGLSWSNDFGYCRAVRDEPVTITNPDGPDIALDARPTA